MTIVSTNSIKNKYSSRVLSIIKSFENKNSNNLRFKEKLFNTGKI